MALHFEQLKGELFMSKESNTTTFTYYRYDERTHREIAVPINIGDVAIDGKIVTAKDIATIQEMSHQNYLDERYYRESKSSLFEHKRMRYDRDPKNEIEPLENLPDESGNDPFSILTREPNPEEWNYDSPSNVDKLLLLLNSLAQEEIELIQDIYYQNISMRAIAKKLNKAEGTIRYRHKKLLAKLKKMLLE